MLSLLSYLFLHNNTFLCILGPLLIITFPFGIHEILVHCLSTRTHTTAPVTQPQSSKTISTIKHSKGDAVISPPVSTLPQNVSGSLLSEKFGVEENQSDVYSLASAALYDVHTKLGRHADVPAGTSLSDALTAKGMAPSPCNSIYSQAAAYTPLPDSAYFSPREKDVSDLYAVPDKKKKLPKQSVDQSKKDLNPNHRVLSSTKSDAGSVSRSMLSEEEAPKLQSSASVSSGFRPAETMPNGYMRPSQWNSNPRPANYSYVSGPPRPADASSTTHRSALLKMEEDLTPSDGKKDSPEYINLRELREELGRVNAPPQIDRSVKPSPPSAQRNLKPGPNLDIDSPPASPPNFPSRTGSVSTPTIVDATDLPRPTRRTMKYTQLDFHSESGQLCFVADQPVGDSSLRAPVPIPRSTSKSKRVTYSDINILATVEMAANSSTEPEEATQKRLSLNEAEMAALAEKPYVNVARDGLPDDETDPDYYTHMRVSSNN